MIAFRTGMIRYQNIKGFALTPISRDSCRSCPHLCGFSYVEEPILVSIK